MELLKLDISGLSVAVPDKTDAVSDNTIDEFLEKAAAADRSLLEGTGPGSDFLGWIDLPVRAQGEELERIIETAEEVRDRRDALVVIGIGGSYLGARAAVDALCPAFGRTAPEILFAGCNLTGDYHADLLDHLADKDFAVNIISKSGTTLEPSIAFRILSAELEKRFGADGARERIIATTDAEKGVLREVAEAKGYRTFIIPPDVGGRFSVLTPVGLVPIAAAGIDVRKLLKGAEEMREAAGALTGRDNPCLLYAAARNALHQTGKTTEILASFNSKLAMICEWWKQLAGESEGKQGRGIYPASVVNTTDLHSLGQWIQDGPRIIFETFLTVRASRRAPAIPVIEGDPDGLNYLAGKTFDDVNDAALEGTNKAHLGGGVPTMRISMNRLEEESLGALFYFFQRAIATSGYILGVNPFDQPGVEAYKKNMFALLDR